MSTSGPFSERVTTAVLLLLWQAKDALRDVTMQELLHKTLAPLPDVQQALSILEARGCRLERTPAGLRLATTALACWGDVLEDVARRGNLRIGRRVMIFSRTTSTNDIAWQCAADPSSDGLVVIADEQSAGRGRLGRTWSAKAGQSLLFSVLLRNDPHATDNLDRLTLLAGLATAVALERVSQNTSRAAPAFEMKWPNDLLIEGKKIAGILVESRTSPDAVVIGVGINVTQHAADFPPELQGHATSLRIAGTNTIDRLAVAAELMNALNHYLSLPPENDTWLAEWKSRCGMLGRQVKLHSDNAIHEGVVTDVMPLHGLVLRDNSGVTRFFSARRASLL